MLDLCILRLNFNFKFEIDLKKGHMSNKRSYSLLTWDLSLKVRTFHGTLKTDIQTIRHLLKPVQHFAAQIEPFLFHD